MMAFFLVLFSPFAIYVIVKLNNLDERTRSDHELMRLSLDQVHRTLDRIGEKLDRLEIKFDQKFAEFDKKFERVFKILLKKKKHKK